MPKSIAPESDGEQVRSLRIFGTTWADRGWRYWIRRVGITVLWACVAALEIGVILAFWSGLVEAANNRVATLGISTVLVGLLLGGFLWAIRGWREVRDAERVGDTVRLQEIVDEGIRSRHKAVVGGTLLGGGGLLAIPAAVLALTLGTFAVIGWVFVFLLMSFGRYYDPEEYLAVTELQRTKR
ncbi:hypothetical protein [Mycobacterium sp. 1274756.6]|uniref:hypothetical protein n=1 Tax=Mycobacterium sp. 1274756.6 TaxID=1834076 RepID=UPI0008024F87|nr:hypothetical protein [Mycobacterium sp. 1274756.6]OBJ73711.1 hypothetical protein A5643_02915 [Mycobacterium sp. 1274756.6]